MRQTAISKGIKSGRAFGRAIKVFSIGTETPPRPMIYKALLLTTMLLGIRADPQGPSYLPPPGTRPSLGGGGGGGGGTGHPDEWAGDPVNYEFSYEVQDAVAGLDFGHHEMRKDQEATGTYHVLLPDGRTQIVDYVADGTGYRPVVRYEGTATYPAPGGSAPGGGSPGISAGDDGYRY